MAVLNLGCGGNSDKENAPPAAVRGITVRKQSMMKRPGAGSKVSRKRPPLRDITFLFLADPRPLTSLAPEGREGPEELVPDAPVLPEAVRTLAIAPSDGVAVKQGRPSLRKGFR
ncbi:hypothetical protein EJB05_25052, partial [Eragrostis curvula]